MQIYLRCFFLYPTNMNAHHQLEKHQIELEEFSSHLAASMHSASMHCAENPVEAVQALRTVFGVMRNRFTFEESLQFIELLPLSLKALYLDGWRISKTTADQFYSLEDLVDEIIAHATESHWYRSNRDELRQVLIAIFQMIGAHAGAAEARENLCFLPEDMLYYLYTPGVAAKPYTDTSIWLS